MIPDLDLMSLVSGDQRPKSDFRMELLKKLLGDLGGSNSNDDNKVLEVSSITAQPLGGKQTTWMDLLKGGY